MEGLGGAGAGKAITMEDGVTVMVNLFDVSHDEVVRGE